MSRHTLKSARTGRFLATSTRPPARQSKAKTGQTLDAEAEMLAHAHNMRERSPLDATFALMRVHPYKTGTPESIENVDWTAREGMTVRTIRPTAQVRPNTTGLRTRKRR